MRQECCRMKLPRRFTVADDWGSFLSSRLLPEEMYGVPWLSFPSFSCIIWSIQSILSESCVIFCPPVYNWQRPGWGSFPPPLLNPLESFISRNLKDGEGIGVGSAFPRLQSLEVSVFALRFELPEAADCSVCFLFSFSCSKQTNPIHHAGRTRR